MRSLGSWDCDAQHSGQGNVHDMVHGEVLGYNFRICIYIWATETVTKSMKFTSSSNSWNVHVQSLTGVH